MLSQASYFEGILISQKLTVYAGTPQLVGRSSQVHKIAEQFNIIICLCLQTTFGSLMHIGCRRQHALLA